MVLDGVAAARRSRSRRRVRRRRPRQLHVPVDVHPGRRPAARRGGGLRVAARGAALGTAPIPGRRARHGRRRCALGGLACIAVAASAHGRLRLPVAAAARVGAVARGGARRRPPGGARDAPRCSAGARSSRSASAATACTCGTGRSSCSLGATHGAVGRFVVALGAHRRRGRAVATATSRRRCATGPSPAGGATAGDGPRRGPLLAVGGTVVVLAGCYVAVDPYDRAAGGDDGDVRGARRPAAPAPVAAGSGRRRRRRRRPPRAAGHRR